jgi:hypothetical protein
VLAYFPEAGKGEGSVTRKLNKILPNFWKKWPKNTKIFTSKLSLKAQNIRIKLLLEPSKKHELKLLVCVKIG